MKKILFLLAFLVFCFPCLARDESTSISKNGPSQNIPSVSRAECEIKYSRFFELFKRFAGHQDLMCYGLKKDPQYFFTGNTTPTIDACDAAWLYYANEIMPITASNPELSWSVFESHLKKYNQLKSKEKHPDWWLLRSSSPFGFIDASPAMGKKYFSIGMIEWPRDAALRQQLIKTLVKGDVLDDSDLYGILCTWHTHPPIRARLPESVVLRYLILPLLSDTTPKRERFGFGWYKQLENNPWPDHFSFENLTLAHATADMVVWDFGRENVLGKSANAALSHEVEALTPEDLQKHPESEWYPELDNGVKLAKKFVLGRLAQADAREALAKLLCAPQAQLDETQAAATLSNWWLFRSANTPALDAGEVSLLATALLRHAAYRDQGADPGPLQALLVAKWQEVWLAQGVQIQNPTQKELKGDAAHWLLTAADAYQALKSTAGNNPIQELIAKNSLIQSIRSDIPRQWQELKNNLSAPSPAPPKNNPLEKLDGILKEK